MVNIPETPDSGSCRCAQLEAEIATLREQVRWFEEQIRLAQHRRFGASSERSDAAQLHLFNEAEATAATAGGAVVEETITYTRKKKDRGQRDAALKNFPVERIEYRLPPEEQQCAACAGPLHEMGEEVRREIQVIPAEVKVVEHVRYKYGCRTCEHEALTTPIVTAPMPRPVHPGSLASASLLAYILHQKYTLGLPLYRQEQDWARLGVPLSRQTLANWVVFAAQEWLDPLYQALRQELLTRDILQADETTVQVLHEEGRAATTKSYMWLYRTGREGPAIVLYEYQETRDGAHARRFLTGFQGYLQVDGYAGYQGLPEVTLAGCWAHARRKWDEALKALPKEARDGPSVARDGLKFCNRLYEVERDVRDATPDERLRARRARSVPILDEFYAWLGEQRERVLPKSATGQAMTYCLNQWVPLQTFLADGRLDIDNNRSERSIKPFVIGRKAFLFMNTPRGAKASAITYSIIETAKENGLNPRAYLQYLFEELPNRDRTDPATWEALMPWSPQLPEHVKSPVSPTPSKQ
jgi:transposase